MSNVRRRFLLTPPLQQSFSLPFFIISYFHENPKPRPQLLLKLYSSCKFFLLKIKIIPILRIEINGITSGSEVKLIFQNSDSDSQCLILSKKAFNSLNCRFYVWSQFIYEGNLNRLGELPKLLAKFCSGPLDYCRIRCQILTKNEFKFLTKDLNRVFIDNVKILDSDKSEIPVEDLILILPKIHYFY